MPTPIVTQYYPDDFQIITLGLNTTGDGADQAMFYADRNIVIDSVVVGTSVADASATCAVKYATSPVAATIASGTAVTNAMDVSAAGTVTATIVTTANEIAAGNWIGLDFASATDSLKGVVQIRFRSRVA